ncbi:hypothetical protein K2173_008513 [Erythroxylum novogranatense]|uniref:DUF4283 domain-containing protein n=1 Tax=Erythroxylum novogranatense TaxID=1862640 RepID=A0AAV8SLF1_9ROSI|nr:hypothetical protein K2173_008513 [Erythroxylum novogranatense]
MAIPDSASVSFPPRPLLAPAVLLADSGKSADLLSSVAPVALVASPMKVDLAGGAWSGRVGASQPRGQLSYHPNVLLDGVVSPPVELLRAGAKAWSNALVGFFWSKRLAFPLVNAWACARWGKKGFEKALLMEDGLFLFKFSPQSNIREILELGPWHIGNQPLFLRQWTTGMSLDRGSVEVLLLWVQFRGLPMEYWTMEGLSHLTSSIGKPICLDSQTTKMERIGFAKICVEVSKDTALPDSLKIRRLDPVGELSYTTISVTYPWKPSATKRH